VVPRSRGPGRGPTEPCRNRQARQLVRVHAISCRSLRVHVEEATSGDGDRRHDRQLRGEHEAYSALHQDDTGGGEPDGARRPLEHGDQAQVRQMYKSVSIWMADSEAQAIIKLLHSICHI
jgi:hypothetical protein